MSIQPILIELPVIPVEPEPARDPAAVAFSHRLAILRGEVEPPDSDVPVCVYCGETRSKDGKLLVESPIVEDYIHEGACFHAFIKHPEVKAMHAQRDAETKAVEDAYSCWVREGQILGGRRNTFIAGFNSLPFLIGDWLVKGEDGGFERRVQQGLYKVAEQLTGYKKKSLQDFAYVSRRVPSSIRIEKLPWAAHQAVASLNSEAHRKQALDHAVEKGWKVRDLRKWLAKAPPELKQVRIEDFKEPFLQRMKRWKKWSGSLFLVLEEEASSEILLAMKRKLCCEQDRKSEAQRLRQAAERILKLADLLIAEEPKADGEQVAQQQAEVSAAAAM